MPGDREAESREPETQMRISVIIPTLNAEKELSVQLDMLGRQDRPADEIIVVDSASEDRTADICETNEKVALIRIIREEFDHGKTRDMALRRANGDIVVFLTQDAIPADEHFLGRLVAPFSRDNLIALSTGRQLPKADATQMEKLVRAYNFPEKSSIRSMADLPEMGIKTFFCPDVCCAYRKDIYLELGGFDYPLRTNEDMFYAARVIHAGYRISYTAEAMVYHSHNLTLREQYRRNYYQGYEIEKRKEDLGVGSYGQEGLRMVRYVSGELLKEGRFLSLMRFGIDCCARKMGNTAGKKAYIQEEKQKANH